MADDNRQLLRHIKFFSDYLGNLCNNNSTEEYYLLRYNAVYSVEIKPTFRRYILPPSARSNKPSKLPALWLATCFHAGSLLGLFDPEYRSDMFLRNVG
jgi:hypothetical protein